MNSVELCLPSKAPSLRAHSEAIYLGSSKKDGLPRFARNDGMSGNLLGLLKSFITLSLVLALTACGTSSHRPRYSGHEENTEGVPGFVNGHKVSPNVKLGQSYEVDGETYVPHYDHDYVEEGMASWYGPGFHGGKTANGEEFDKNEMTAAHRTLPLPSIVRVTLVSTGKSAYVRVNDRGPFAKSRIIDLSYGAAKEIGLIGPGTGRVRVEYMPEESQRFVDLLAQGRDPKDINVADEVIGKHATAYAENNVHQTVWDRANPISSASAAVPHTPVTNETFGSVSQDTVEARDLMPAAKPLAPAPQSPLQAAALSGPEILPPATLPPASPAVVKAPVQTAALTPPTAALVAPAPIAPRNTPSEPTGTIYVQLGAFLQEANAVHLQKKVIGVGPSLISPTVNDAGSTLYRVRMGPYSHVEESSRVLAQLNALGISPKLVTK